MGKSMLQKSFLLSHNISFTSVRSARCSELNIFEILKRCEQEGFRIFFWDRQAGMLGKICCSWFGQRDGQHAKPFHSVGFHLSVLLKESPVSFDLILKRPAGRCSPVGLQSIGKKVSVSLDHKEGVRANRKPFLFAIFVKCN